MIIYVKKSFLRSDKRTQNYSSEPHTNKATYQKACPTDSHTQRQQCRPACSRSTNRAAALHPPPAYTQPSFAAPSRPAASPSATRPAAYSDLRRSETPRRRDPESHSASPRHHCRPAALFSLSSPSSSSNLSSRKWSPFPSASAKCSLAVAAWAI